MAPSPPSSTTPVGTDILDSQPEDSGLPQYTYLDKIDELPQDLADTKDKSTTAAAEITLAPVPVLKLFRFATKTDNFLNIV
ncbi:hypothetical protein IWW57_002603, partial [Coemansia sp. S610]